MNLCYQSLPCNTLATEHISVSNNEQGMDLLCYTNASSQDKLQCVVVGKLNQAGFNNYLMTRLIPAHI